MQWEQNRNLDMELVANVLKANCQKVNECNKHKIPVGG